MPTITADGDSFETEDGKRLVLALEDNGIDVSHRCGGFARCTTCRVEFSDGEPTEMTRAEFDKLGDKRADYRLSCQITCDHDMTVRVLMPVHEMDYDEAGDRPEDEVTPDPETFPVDELVAEDG